MQISYDIPTMDMFMDVIYQRSTDEMLDVISKCILQIYNGEEVFDKASTSDKDRKDFIENLTQEQFLKLQHFFKTMTKLKHEVKVTNLRLRKKVL